MVTDMTAVLAEVLYEDAVYVVAGRPDVTIRSLIDYEPVGLPGGAPGREQRCYLTLLKAEVELPERAAIVKINGQQFVLDALRSRDDDRFTVWAKRL